MSIVKSVVEQSPFSTQMRMRHRDPCRAVPHIDISRPRYNSQLTTLNLGIIDLSTMASSMPKNFDEWKAKMANFDLDAILRGAQLTVVGAHRALQNPRLFTNEHYRQAALAVAAGLAIRMLIEVPVSSNAGLPMLVFI